MTDGSSRDDSPPPDWEHLSQERVGEYALFNVRREVVRSPRDAAELTFDIVESLDGVAVLARTSADELVLVEQYRAPLRDTFLELPAGVLESDEDCVEAGLRELREETGYTGERARRIGQFVLNPSWQTTVVHVVVCDEAIRSESKDLDKGEDTRIRVLPMADVEDAIAAGRLDNAVALAALALLRAVG